LLMLEDIRDMFVFLIGDISSIILICRFVF
jgi:hypothetical protein